MSEDVTHQLERLVGGDASAAAWLYDSYAAGLFRRLRWRYPRLEPEDLLHDLFVAVFKDDCRLLRELKDRSPLPIPGSVLERRLWDLACGLATNRQRSHGHSKTLQLAETFDEADARPSAERAAVDKDRLERLADCIERTNARVFLYFQLRFRDGLAPEEIVGVTGWSKKATYKLKQRLNDAVKRCAEALGWDG
ncbi:MAG: ECF-type sigma factor [Acidobacteriota bacterium]